MVLSEIAELTSPIAKFKFNALGSTGCNPQAEAIWCSSQGPSGGRGLLLSPTGYCVPALLSGSSSGSCAECYVPYRRPDVAVLDGVLGAVARARTERPGIVERAPRYSAHAKVLGHTV